MLYWIVNVKYYYLKLFNCVKIAQAAEAVEYTDCFIAER